MFSKLLYLLKKFIVAALFIYAYDMLCVSFGLVIPINFVTILLVGIFNFSGMICLIFFSLLL